MSGYADNEYANICLLILYILKHQGKQGRKTYDKWLTSTVRIYAIFLWSPKLCAQRFSKESKMRTTVSSFKYI